MSHKKSASRTDMILDLLAEELIERIRSRGVQKPTTPSTSQSTADAPKTAQDSMARAELGPTVETEQASPGPESMRLRSEGGLEAPAQAPGPPHAARLMIRLALLLLGSVIAINLPVNCHGLTLATAMPDAEALIIREGLVVKEAGRDEIYVYQEGAFRWISSLDAFEHYGYTWGDVHMVQDGFLLDYEIGYPMHVLLKCQQSPHIYRLENGVKRWIVDIETFTVEGHIWDDVRFVPCEELRRIPDGETIPPGRGPAPVP